MPYNVNSTSANFCTFTCTNTSNTNATYNKHFCKNKSIRVLTTYNEFMTELMTNGPVMVGLSIYEDFYNYGSGIYVYTTGDLVGGHAMKLVGWNHTDSGELYWICQNQWGSSWGMQGYVNVKAG